MEQRQLCAELISIHLTSVDGSEREIVGILEEIATSRACLNLDEPVEAGSSMRFRCDRCSLSCEFNGSVTGCRAEGAAGYTVEMQFAPGNDWSPEHYRPQHLFNPADLERKCSGRKVCPKEVISALVEPDAGLAARVRMAGKEVARLCGELDAGSTADCFHSLFRTHADCRLFAEFLESYRRERRRQPHARKRRFRDQVESLVQLVATIPDEVLESGGCVAPDLIPLQGVLPLPEIEHPLQQSA